MRIEFEQHELSHRRRLQLEHALWPREGFGALRRPDASIHRTLLLTPGHIVPIVAIAVIVITGVLGYLLDRTV